MRRSAAIAVVCALTALLAAGCGSRKPVTVLHLGDSHTAPDHFSGHLRTLFQKRYGRGPRGMLPPGVIHPGYQPHQVSLRSEGEWQLADAWLHPEAGPYGLSGYRLMAEQADARLIYELAGGDEIMELRLGIYGGPETGRLRLEVDGRKPHLIPTRMEKPGYELRVVPLRRAVRRVTLSPAGDGPVTLLSVGLNRPGAGGVTYVSHGVPRATIALLERMDEDIVRRELKALDPELIILAFGTNEGFNDALDAAAYRRLIEAQLAWLARLAPGARIALAGPPDANRLVNRDQGRGREGERWPCIAGFGGGAVEGSGDAAYWTVPEMLGEVRRIQRQVAEARGITFWDWSEVMGGPCGMHDWVNSVPPRALADHVHMTGAGAEESAQEFFRLLRTTYGDGWGPSSREAERNMP